MPQLLYKLESLYHRTIPHWLLQPRYCWVYRLALSGDRKCIQDSRYLLRWAADEDLAKLKQRCALTDYRLAEGDRAVILLEENQLVGVLWIATEQYRDWDTGLLIELQPHQAWMYGAWVHRNLRGKKLYSQMIRFVSNELVLSGRSEMLFAIDWTNGHSQQIHRSYGANQIGKLLGVELFGRKNFRIQLDPNLCETGLASGTQNPKCTGTSDLNPALNCSKVSNRAFGDPRN